MPDPDYPPCLSKPVRISGIDCRTVFGDPAETARRLAAGEVGLKAHPVYGADGGEPVPLALRSGMDITVPPRWWEDLASFIRPLAGQGWGGPRRPVFVTSSNFGIDGLYGLKTTGDARFADWATPHQSVRHIIERQGWGDNVSLFSHACVSAQLGMFQAAQFLHKDLADAVLVLSFDYVGPFVSAGFHSLKILNTGFPAPYQDQETGSIGLGDGVAWAILEKDGPGPVIQAQALYNEMYHFTSNAPEGTGFRKALGNLAGQVDPGRFWIKGHGTGTLEAGRMEAASLQEFFPGSPLVSWKGSLGHTLGSCALVELAIALEAASSGTIPGTVGTRGPCFTENVQTEAFPASPYSSCLLLSNAFGGAHGAMILNHG